VWTALRSGDAGTASRQFAAFMKLNVLCARFGNPRVIKDALRILGGHGGHLRRPYLPLSELECAELERGLSELGLAATEPFD
jgi:dihydrodipicolinate synthase/N-acetylneuraminate lyase